MVATVTLALLTILGMGVAGGAAQRLSRPRARQVLSDLGRGRVPDIADVDATITLEGELETEDGRAAVTLFRPGTVASTELVPTAVTQPHGALWLRIHDHRVEVAAPVQVLAGSVERGRGTRRSVRAGDRVRIRGRLQALPAAQATGGYRHSDVAFRLVAPEVAPWPGAPLPLASVTLRNRTSSWVAIAGGACVAILPSLGLLARVHHAAGPDLSPATTPPARPDLCASVRALPANLRPDLAAAQLGGCDDDELAGELYWQNGDFERASDAFARVPATSPVHLEAHLFAQHLDRAVTGARQLLQAWYPAASDARADFECILEELTWLSTRDPALSPEARLQWLDGTEAGPGRGACVRLAAYHLPSEGRRLHVWESDTFASLPNETFWELSAKIVPSGGRGGGTEYGVDALREPRHFVDLRGIAWQSLWLEDHRRAPGRPTKGYIDALAFVTHSRAYFGLPVAAQLGELAGYPREIPGRYPNDPERPGLDIDEMSYNAVELSAIAALYDGDLASARRLSAVNDSHDRRWLDAAIDLALSSHREVPETDRMPGDWSADERELFVAARSGDGRAVVAFASKAGPVAIQMLPYVARTLERNVNDVRHWLEAQAPAPCRTCGAFPLAEDAGERFRAARALGDDASAAAWRSIAARLGEKLIDPRTGILALELESLRAP
jgi:hypothetical protein